MSNVARALDEVRVLQLAVAVCALELGPAPRPVIAPIAGAGDLVTSGPGGRGPGLKKEILINYDNFTKTHRVHVSPVPERSWWRKVGPSLEAGWDAPPPSWALAASYLGRACEEAALLVPPSSERLKNIKLKENRTIKGN